MDDDDGYSVSTASPRKRTFGSSATNANARPPKRKVTKKDIGGPSGFKHEAHMGYEEVSCHVPFLLSFEVWLLTLMAR